VAVSTAEVPKGTLGLLRAVVRVGVDLGAVAGVAALAALTVDMLATARMVKANVVAP